MAKAERILCVICRVDDARVIWKKDDLEVVKCRRCGLVYHNPVHQQEKYDENYYADEVKTRPGGYYNTYVHEKDEMRLNEIAKFKSGGRLLDVGCAFGFFLKHAKDRGYDVEGVDVSAYALAHAKDKLGIENVHHGTLQELKLPAQSFDVITMWDAMEHVSDPQAVGREIHRLLNSGGVFVMEVPNEFYSLARIVWSLRNRKAPTPVTDPPTHLFFFDHKTVHKLLDACGFKTVSFRTTGFANPDNPRPEWMKKSLNRVAELTGRGTKMVVVSRKK